MSSTEFKDSCPKCMGEMICYTDTKIQGNSGECLDCGYFYYTETGQKSLTELNELRRQMGLKPLKCLPEI